MIIIGVFLIAAIAVISMLSGDNREKVMNDYCTVECKQNILRKHKLFKLL